MPYCSIFLSLLLTAFVTSCSSISHSPTPDGKLEISNSYKYRTNLSGEFRTDWWRSFHDPKLNEMQKLLTEHNKDLQIAFANYQSALGAAGITRATKLPRLDATGAITRTGESESNNFFSENNPFTSYDLRAQLGYEVDLWGRIRQLVRASNADAAATRYLLAEAHVSLQTQLADHYFLLRFIDAEADILRKAVATRRESLALAEARLDGGVSDGLDSARAKGLLATAKADLISLEAERTRLENTIAVLVGRNASHFSIAKRNVPPSHLPTIPVGLPAKLITRRPDIAVAYARLEASSARLGVAQTNPYPKLRLTAIGGLFSISKSSFLKSSSKIFEIGPNIETPLFAGGRLKADLLRTRSNQAADLARFQKASLTAFAEVETSLARIQTLRRELVQRDVAAKAATKGQKIARIRYEEGADTYLAVIDNERERLTAQRTALRTRGQLYTATIELIKALGGGFSRKN